MVLVGHGRLCDGLVRVHVERAVELVAHHLLLHAAHADRLAVRAAHRLKERGMMYTSSFDFFSMIMIDNQ